MQGCCVAALNMRSGRTSESLTSVAAVPTFNEILNMGSPRRRCGGYYAIAPMRSVSETRQATDARAAWRAVRSFRCVHVAPSHSARGVSRGALFCFWVVGARSFAYVGLAAQPTLHNPEQQAGHPSPIPAGSPARSLSRRAIPTEIGT